MSKPSELELRTALDASALMKEMGKDPYYIAKTLLNLNYRMKYYEQLFTAADRYMNHGLAEHERMALLRSIEKVKDAESKIANQHIDDFGLE